jgi:hypothetical protein
MPWWWVMVGAILGAGLAAPAVLAQSGPDTPGAGGPVVVAPLGIPIGPQIIDVRWSGDRMGEFTILTTLPPAFRRAEGHSGPARAESPLVRPTPTPAPLTAPR